MVSPTPGFSSLSDEVAALRWQVQGFDQLVQHLEAKNAWLTRMIYGTKRIDNNQAERVLRPIFIGRKNWYFIGREDTTVWAATNFTIFESCRLA